MLTMPSDSATRFFDAAWLEGVDASIRLAIWKSLDERAEVTGFCLLEQDRPNHQFWFVAEGSVAVERSRPGGRSEVLARLDGPAIYGTTTFFRNSAPTMTIRATTPIRGWTLEREAYEQLRVNHPEAAEALALAAVRSLSEHFDMLDRRLTSVLADLGGDHPRASEWSSFRSRLFEEPAA